MALVPNPLKQELIDALERIRATEALPGNQITALTDELRVNQAAVEALGQQLVDAKRALLEAENRRFELYERAPVAYLTLDDSGRICDLNSNAAALLGMAPAQLSDSMFSTRLAADEANRFYQHLRLCRRRRIQMVDEFAIRVGDTTRYMKLVSVPVRSAGGEPLYRTVLSDVTAHRVAEQTLQAREAQLQAVSSDLESAREDEKNRFARELNDELGATLTALGKDIAWLEKNLPDGSPAIHDRLAAMSHLVTDSAEAMRRVVNNLRPTLLEESGLAAAITQYATEFQEQRDIVCKLDLALDGVAVDRKSSIALFRIVQEALTNVARHASASQVGVRCGREEKMLILVIEDDGRGFDEEKLRELGSHGLRNILERAQSVGGSVRIKSRLGAGSTITVTVPAVHARPGATSRADRGLK